MNCHTHPYGTQFLLSFFYLSLSFFVHASPYDIPLTPKQELDYMEVANQLRCPTCTGLSILQSDAAFSLQIRKVLREEVAKGKTQPELRQFFVDRFGPWILREPPKEGFHLFIWVMPSLLLLLGPLAIWFWRRKEGKKKAQTPRSLEKSTEEWALEMTKKLEELRVLQKGDPYGG